MTTVSTVIMVTVQAQSGAHKPQTGRKRTTTGRTIPGIDGARPSQADSGFRGLAAGTG